MCAEDSIAALLPRVDAAMDAELMRMQTEEDAVVDAAHTLSDSSSTGGGAWGEPGRHNLLDMGRLQPVPPTPLLRELAGRHGAPEQQHQQQHQQHQQQKQQHQQQQQHHQQQQQQLQHLPQQYHRQQHDEQQQAGVAAQNSGFDATSSDGLWAHQHQPHANMHALGLGYEEELTFLPLLPQLGEPSQQKGGDAPSSATPPWPGGRAAASAAAAPASEHEDGHAGPADVGNSSKSDQQAHRSAGSQYATGTSTLAGSLVSAQAVSSEPALGIAEVSPADSELWASCARPRRLSYNDDAATVGKGLPSTGPPANASASASNQQAALYGVSGAVHDMALVTPLAAAVGAAAAPSTQQASVTMLALRERFARVKQQ